jgi:hypothetical protein
MRYDRRAKAILYEYRSIMPTQQEELVISSKMLMEYVEGLYKYKCISKQVADDIYTQLIILKDLTKDSFITYIMRKNEELQ